MSPRLGIVLLQCIWGSLFVSSNQSSFASHKILSHYFCNVTCGEYNWERFPADFSCFVAERLRGKYLNKRLAYNSNHPGSYNSFIITNQEAHMIYGNMNEQGKHNSKKEKFQRLQTTFQSWTKL